MCGGENSATLAVLRSRMACAVLRSSGGRSCRAGGRVVKLMGSSGGGLGSNWGQSGARDTRPAPTPSVGVRARPWSGEGVRGSATGPGGLYPRPSP